MDLLAGKSTESDPNELDIEIDFGEVVIISLPDPEESMVVMKKYRMRNDPNVIEIRLLSHGDILESSILSVKYKDRETAKKECKRLASDLKEKRMNVEIAEDMLDHINRLEELNDEQRQELGLGVNGEFRPYIVYLICDQLNLSSEDETEEGKEKIGQTLAKVFETYGKIIRFEIAQNETICYYFARYASAYATFLAYNKRDWKGGVIYLEMDNPEEVIETLSAVLV